MRVRDLLLAASILTIGTAGAPSALGQEAPPSLDPGTPASPQWTEHELYRLAPGYGWRADHVSSGGPAGIRPLLVDRGQWRFSTRLEIQSLDGLGDRTGVLSSQEAFANFGYGIVPEKQETRRQVFELGYGVSDDLTIGLEVPYIDKTMDSRTSAGTPFETSAKGIGDVRLWAHNKWFRWGSEQAVWSVALDVPTGSFDETDVRPGSAGPVVLPYSMQLGTGTYDVTPMLSWTGYHDRWSWGGNLLHTWRIGGPNDRRYTVGTYRAATLWTGREITRSLIGNLRLQWSRQGDTHGQDPALDLALSPAEHPHQQKAKRLDLTAGLTYHQAEGLFRGLRFGLEFGFPLYQRLRGPQLRTEFLTTVSLRWSF